MLRKDFLEQEVCEWSQEVKMRRNKNHRHSKHVRMSSVTWETPQVAPTATRRGPMRQARCAHWCRHRLATRPFLGKDRAASVKAADMCPSPLPGPQEQRPGTRALDLLREAPAAAP